MVGRACTHTTTTTSPSDRKLAAHTHTHKKLISHARACARARLFVACVAVAAAAAKKLERWTRSRACDWSGRVARAHRCVVSSLASIIGHTRSNRPKSLDVLVVSAAAAAAANVIVDGDGDGDADDAKRPQSGGRARLSSRANAPTSCCNNSHQLATTACRTPRQWVNLNSSNNDVGDSI